VTIIRGLRAEQLEELERELQDGLPDLLTDVAHQLSGDWPGYADFLATERTMVIEAAMDFVRQLLEVAARGATPSEQGHMLDGTANQLFEAIGRLQWEQGNDLTSILTAYQVGARAAWSHVSITALRLSVDPVVLAALAEAVFVFVGDLSAATAHGYAQEQYESSMARERFRDELVELLLSDRSSPVAIGQAAQRAGWPLPRLAAIVLADREDTTARTVIERATPICLRVHQGELFGLIVPDPEGPGHRTRLAERLRGAGAVVGPAVPLDRLPQSARVAATAERLLRAGALTADPVFVDEHLDTLIVHGNEPLLNALRTQELAPFDGLSVATRERLQQTLESWLRNLGDRQAVAAELHVHPRTVRYRLMQLRELYGDRLDDPGQRARLFLALNWGAAIS
jgi:hypothetical protein